MPPQHRQRDSLEFLNNWGLFMGWGLICDFESIFAQVVFWIISMLSLYHLSWKITSQHWDKVTRDITACKIAPVTILQFATFRIQTGMKVDKFTLQNRMILRVLVLAAWASAELPKVVFFLTITFAPGISERGPLFWAKHDRAKDNVCHGKCKCSRVRQDTDKNEKQKKTNTLK